jgi:hypothetical protein
VALRTRKQVIEGEVSVVMARGAPHPFIVAGEGHIGAGKGETPLMARRLDDGLGDEIKGEIKALSEYLAWHLEVGGQAARGGRRRRLATVGWRGRKEGDGADRWAPHGSDVRERRCLCQSAQSQREYAFREIRQRGLGRVGRARVRRPVGEAIGSVRLG